MAYIIGIDQSTQGTKALLPMHYQLCDACTSDYAGMAESKLNKRIVMAFRRHESPFEEAVLPLRGLAAGCDYSVTNADTGETLTLTGAQLMDRGLRVTLAERPQAALFRYWRAPA